VPPPCRFPRTPRTRLPQTAKASPRLWRTTNGARGRRGEKHRGDTPRLRHWRAKPATGTHLAIGNTCLSPVALPRSARIPEGLPRLEPSKSCLANGRAAVLPPTPTPCAVVKPGTGTNRTRIGVSGSVLPSPKGSNPSAPGNAGGQRSHPIRSRERAQQHVAAGICAALTPMKSEKSKQSSRNLHFLILKASTLGSPARTHVPAKRPVLSSRRPEAQIQQSFSGARQSQRA